MKLPFFRNLTQKICRFILKLHNTTVSLNCFHRSKELYLGYQAQIEKVRPHRTLLSKGALDYLSLGSVKMFLDLWNFCCLILASEFLLFCGCISPWGLSPWQLIYFLLTWQIFNVKHTPRSQGQILAPGQIYLELCNSALVFQLCVTNPCRTLLPWEGESIFPVSVWPVPQSNPLGDLVLAGCMLKVM